jgi:hypothetical protein
MLFSSGPRFVWNNDIQRLTESLLKKENIWLRLIEGLEYGNW